MQPPIAFLNLADTHHDDTPIEVNMLDFTGNSMCKSLWVEPIMVHKYICMS